ncbi:ORF17 [Ranid herpesvirus 2]|uniref:ORF17 n=1 Tax=Ranid herpesvirus 2 TaxID=389214 RepID=Q14W89_9VIRU|nr:ORF17 [Ranid herpesvirus 2]ABG25668.1 ORF17 [Ranid herpesvirus 2]
MADNTQLTLGDRVINASKAALLSHGDWPHLMHAVLWNECVNYRLHLGMYIESLKLWCGSVTMLSQESQMEFFVGYALYTYDARICYKQRFRSREDTVPYKMLRKLADARSEAYGIEGAAGHELRGLTHFLEHQLPSYRRYMTHYGESVCAAYQYNKIFGASGLWLPPVLGMLVDDWREDTLPESQEAVYLPSGIEARMRQVDRREQSFLYEIRKVASRVIENIEKMKAGEGF